MNKGIISPFVPSVLPQIQIKMPFSIKSGRKLQVIIFDGKNAVISGLHQKITLIMPAFMRMGKGEKSLTWIKTPQIVPNISFILNATAAGCFVQHRSRGAWHLTASIRTERREKTFCQYF